MKRSIVLGSRESIGKGTLDVIRSLPDVFRAVGLACAQNAEQLAAQAREFRPVTRPKSWPWTGS